MKNALILATAIAVISTGASAMDELPGGPWVTFSNGSDVSYSVGLGSIQRVTKDGVTVGARVMIHREGGDENLKPYAFDGMQFNCRGRYRFALWGDDTKGEQIVPGTLASKIEDAACWGPKGN